MYCIYIYCLRAPLGLADDRLYFMIWHHLWLCLIKYYYHLIKWLAPHTIRVVHSHPQHCHHFRSEKKIARECTNFFVWNSSEAISRYTGKCGSMRLFYAMRKQWCLTAYLNKLYMMAIYSPSSKFRYQIKKRFNIERKNWTDTQREMAAASTNGRNQLNFKYTLIIYV